MTSRADSTRVQMMLSNMMLRRIIVPSASARTVYGSRLGA